MRQRDMLLLIFAVSTSCLIVYFQIRFGLPRKFDKRQVVSCKEGNQPDDTSNRVVSLSLAGGVGNCIWQYASLYGLARKSKRRAVICGQGELRRIFTNLSIPIVDIEKCNPGAEFHPDTDTVRQVYHLKYEVPVVRRLVESSERVLFVCCYLQNLAYFAEYFDELRADLRVRPDLQRAAQDYLWALLSVIAAARDQTVGRKGASGEEALLAGTPLVWVNVHVRRSDILHEPTVLQPDTRYFRDAMDVVRRKYRGTGVVIFVVVTDDVAWCRENVRGDDVFYTGDSGVKSRELDFAIATACNHSVISVGTFGWWVGFVTGGDVVYVRNWVVGPWLEQYEPDQFFPHDWTGLDAIPMTTTTARASKAVAMTEPSIAIGATNYSTQHQPNAADPN